CDKIPSTYVAELGQRMTDFVTTVRQDTDEIYVQLDDTHDDRLVMSGQLNLLHKDRHFHARTARLRKSKAKISREAWAQSMDASDTARSKVRALRTTVLAQHTEIRDLRAADCKQEAQLVEALTLRPVVVLRSGYVLAVLYSLLSITVTIMSDSEDSTFTYTTVSSPYEGRSRDLSPGVDGPPVMPEDPYAYVVAVFQALPPPDYVPGPKEPEQAPPLPSPGYIPESDLDEDLEEDDDEDPEEDPANYPADHDDDGEEEEPSRDDANEEDEEQDEDDDDKEEEHLASADSIRPPPALRVMARISFRPQPPTLSFTKEDAERFLAMPIPPPSPVTSLSSPLQQIPSPPLPASPPILPIPLPAASSPLQLLSSDHRADRPDVTFPPRKRLSIVYCPRYKAGESSVAAAARPIEEDIGYGIRDTWIDPRDVAEEEALTTIEGVNTRVTELAAVQEQDTQDIYGVMEDTQGMQTEIFQRVEALVDDSHYYYETGRLVDQKARCSQEAWAHSIGLSSAVHFELHGYITYTWVQDQRIDAQDTLIATLTTQLSSLQGHLATALENGTKKAAPKRTTRLNPGETSNPNQAPSTTTTTVTNAQLQAMIDQGVNAALVARDANRTGDDSHTSGTGVRRTERVTQECTYQDFMKCQPLYFKGTKEVVELTQWFERMEMVFRISNCLAENQVKFGTCTLLAGALTWWNSHVRIIGNDAAYVMTWIELKKKMAEKYCPRNEMKKIETEFWNLEVQGTDVTRYNQHFQELALLCVRTYPEESDRVERYISGMPDSIHGSVAASKPKTMQEATKMATRLMDKKIRTYAERQATNKRKFKDTSRNNQG
nr:reverse transcriptase domain-containing protein [Tanacetum cinerariifolium]